MFNCTLHTARTVPSRGGGGQSPPFFQKKSSCFLRDTGGGRFSSISHSIYSYLIYSLIYNNTILTSFIIFTYSYLTTYYIYTLYLLLLIKTNLQNQTQTDHHLPNQWVAPPVFLRFFPFYSFFCYYFSKKIRTHYFL